MTADDRARDYEAVCQVLGMADHAEGVGWLYPWPEAVVERIKEMKAKLDEHEVSRYLRPLDDWHDDDGDVLWWKVPVCEPPHVGSPLDDDFPDYVTHWTPIPEPTFEACDPDEAAR